MNASNQKRRFEFKSEKSYKFWTVQQTGNIVHVSYGRIGSPGTPSEKRFASTQDAENFMEKKIKEKLKAGYQELIKKEIRRKTNAELWQDLELHEPFIQSILQNPDDQDNYLVYADWLMERGDPRGEYIHCQWKIADYDTPLWEIETLKNQANSIHSDHWRDWTGELAQFVHGKVGFRFNRGFIDQISINGAHSDLAKCLQESPHTRLARELSIAINPRSEPGMMNDFEVGMKILAQTNFGNVRHFRPATGHANRLAIPTFELIDAMPRLEKLTLNNSFAETDLRSLFQLSIPSLKDLRIAEQNGGETVINLCRSNWLEQLRTIELACNLSDAICQRLAECLDPIQIETIYLSKSISEESTNLFEKHEINVVQD